MAGRRLGAKLGRDAPLFALARLAFVSPRLHFVLLLHLLLPVAGRLGRLRVEDLQVGRHSRGYIQVEVLRGSQRAAGDAQQVALEDISVHIEDAERLMRELVLVVRVLNKNYLRLMP